MGPLTILSSGCISGAEAANWCNDSFSRATVIRGNFIPGLSALDTSAQILAWALVFGYAQQLFTRLVDKQGQAVLDNAHGNGKTTATATSPAP